MRLQTEGALDAADGRLRLACSLSHRARAAAPPRKDWDDACCAPVTLESRVAVISRSGSKWIDHVLTELNIPDREILLAHSPVVVDNFPNGKLK